MYDISHWFLLRSSDFENLNDEQTELHTQINSGLTPDSDDSSPTPPTPSDDLFAEVDKLLEGGDRDKYRASELLGNNKQKVKHSSAQKFNFNIVHVL